VQFVPARLLPALGVTRRPVHLLAVPLLLLAATVRRRGVLAVFRATEARLPLR